MNISKMFHVLVTMTLVIATGLMVSSPAYADTDYVSITITAEANSTTLPSTVDYVVSVHYVDGPGTNNSSVTVTFPAAISSASGDCQVISNVATCSGLQVDGAPDPVFTFIGTVALLALGQFATTAAYLDGTPVDPVQANNSMSASCTAVTSLLVTCP